MTKPSESFQRFIQKKGYKFFVLANEDYYEDVEHNTPEFYYVAFGFRKPGFIDDGWYLDQEDKDTWLDIDQYGNSDDFRDEVAKLLSHPAFGMELYSCSYEVEEEDLQEVEDYLTSLGFVKDKAAWIEGE